MSDFLSPVDPIFFMHHSNIDRLWDVWTRKQQAFDPHNPAAPIQYPTTPLNGDLTTWNSEPFLFFVDSAGKPPTKQHSGDYNEAATFNYDYQPGSGEVVVPTMPVAPLPLANKIFSGKMAAAVATFQRGSLDANQIPNDLLQTLATNERLRLIAKIEVQVPSETRAMRLHVLINPTPGIRSVDFADPSYAGTFEFFGSHSMGNQGHDMQTVAFTIGITDAVNRLFKANRLNPDVPLDLHVVAATSGVELMPYEVKVSKVSLQSL